MESWFEYDISNIFNSVIRNYIEGMNDCYISNNRNIKWLFDKHKSTIEVRKILNQSQLNNHI
jgi:hypothetical protein